MIKLVLMMVFLLSITACGPSRQVVNTQIPNFDIIPTRVVTNTQTPVLEFQSTQTRARTNYVTPTKTETASSLSSMLVESTPAQSANSEFIRPASHLISSITGERQAYALSCESRAAVDWAGYYEVHILEADFQFNLPFSDNPDFGFVGVTTGKWGQVPPYDYGVHATPVAELLREYGVPAVAVKDFDLESLKDRIAQDHPVLTWVIGNVEGGVPHIFTDSQGNQVTVAAYEHVVIVIGYNDETDRITYMNNGKYYETPSSVFENSWSVLEYMAIYHEGVSQP